MLILLLLLLTSCAPANPPPIVATITVQTDEAVRLRQELAQSKAETQRALEILKQCGQAYCDLEQKCSEL